MIFAESVSIFLLFNLGHTEVSHDCAPPVSLAYDLVGFLKKILLYNDSLGDWILNTTCTELYFTLIMLSFCIVQVSLENLYYFKRSNKIQCPILCKSA